MTFAQSCKKRVGYSRLGEALVRGLDAHAALGAQMLGWSYERMAAALADKKSPDHKLAKAFRQCAKWGNFGFMGGMGPVKFTLTQRRQGEDTPHPSGPSVVWDGRAFVPGYKGMRLCILVDGADRCGAVKITEWKKQPCPPTCRACIEVAVKLKAAWLETWPEAREYLAWHSRNVEDVGEVVQLGSGRVRGGTRYASESNGDFQELLAHVAKWSLIRVVRAQYVRGDALDPTGILYGSRTAAFLHDELWGEARLEVLPEVADQITRIMVATFREWCPDYADACDAEPAIAERWYKAMSPVRDASGRLQCWKPS